MRDVDEGDADLALQVLEFDLHLLAELEVEGAERFVEEQHLGSVDQCPGEGHPLLLAAGELVGLAPFHTAHLDEPDRPVDQVGSLVLVDPAHLEAESDVGPDVHVWEEGVTLEHGVDGTLVGRTKAHLLTVNAQGALGGQFEAGDHAQGGRLAAARGAEEGKELAVRDSQVDVVDGDDIAEALGDAPEFDRRGGFAHGAEVPLANASRAQWLPTQ